MIRPSHSTWRDPLAAVLVGLIMTAATAVSAEVVYHYTEPNRDGIGKVYMGREISRVMGHQGADWLERPNRVREERTDLLLQNLAFGPADTVADLGAGTGYFSFPIATRLPQGRLLAVDIQPEMLAIIKQRAKQKAVMNIETILATESDPGIPPGSTDLALLVDAYHEFSFPGEVMQGVLRGLKPGGHLVLVEYRGEDPQAPIKRLHKMTEAQARLELETIGFEFIENQNYLPQQHVLIFRKPG